jgi:hypothetical protein
MRVEVGDKLGFANNCDFSSMAIVYQGRVIEIKGNLGHEGTIGRKRLGVDDVGFGIQVPNAGHVLNGVFKRNTLSANLIHGEEMILVYGLASPGVDNVVGGVGEHIGGIENLSHC